MRTTTVTITDTASRTVKVDYPNSVAFMYSRQPVIVTFTSNAGSVASVAVAVTHSSGRTYTETRARLGSSVEFDISRIMQLLASDVDIVTRRAYSGGSLAETFSLTVKYTTTAGLTMTALEVSSDIIGMYGALDQGEIYGEHTQRRLWVNFPQTFNLWKDANGEVAFVTDDAYIFPDISPDKPCNECNLMNALSAVGERELINSLRTGVPLRNLGLTWRSRIQDGTETPEELRTITLIPDCHQPGDGTYLRWLNRRGEMSYWLFTNSKLRVTTAQTDSFSRYYSGDPAALVSSVYQNSQKVSYREVREMVLGAVGLSLDEFDDLCDLASSPVVERLMPQVTQEDQGTDTIFDGGTALQEEEPEVVIESSANLDTEIEGGDAKTGKETTSTRWQRVNVVAGTFERSIRRNTPSRQDLEIIIELPERNTIKL